MDRIAELETALMDCLPYVLAPEHENKYTLDLYRRVLALLRTN